MPLFKRIAIVGTGLIGGSIALAVKKNRIASTIVGVCRHKKNAAYAVQEKILDQCSTNLGIVTGSDLVILATPVHLIIPLADKLMSYIDSRQCIVTDVGSTKHIIAETLTKHYPLYVGSHPLAGLERKGAYNADSALLMNSVCIVTKKRDTNVTAFKKIVSFWKKTGMHTISMSPKQHDSLVAWISHLPHAVAYALVNTIPLSMLPYAASGLKDTTRIAGSDPLLWADIFLQNKDNVIKALAQFKVHIARFQRALQASDRNELIRVLSKAQKKRRQFK